MFVLAVLALMERRIVYNYGQFLVFFYGKLLYPFEI